MEYSYVQFLVLAFAIITISFLGIILNRSNIIKDTHISECEINIIDKSIIDYNIDNTNSKEELYKKIDLLLR